MISLFGTKWGETWPQRLVDWWMARIKTRFDRAGFAYSEAVTQQEASMREALDVRGLCKLAWEGESAITFIELVNFFGGPELLDYLNEEIRAARLKPNVPAHAVTAAKFCLNQLRTRCVSGFKRGSVATGTYLYRVVGTTWYERAITIPFMAGVIFAVYVLFASTAIAEARAFWDLDYPEADIQELESRLFEENRSFRNQDRDAISKDDLIAYFRDAGRYYQLVHESGSEKQIELAVLMMNQATLYIAIREKVDLGPSDNLPAPMPQLPGQGLIARR